MLASQRAGAAGSCTYDGASFGPRGQRRVGASTVAGEGWRSAFAASRRVHKPWYGGSQLGRTSATSVADVRRLPSCRTIDVSRLALPPEIIALALQLADHDRPGLNSS